MKNAISIHIDDTSIISLSKVNQNSSEENKFIEFGLPPRHIESLYRGSDSFKFNNPLLFCVLCISGFF